MFCVLKSTRRKKLLKTFSSIKKYLVISAHFTANAQSCAEMKIRYCKNDKLVCLQVFVVAVKSTFLNHD